MLVGDVLPRGCAAFWVYVYVCVHVQVQVHVCLSLYAFKHAGKDQARDYDHSQRSVCAYLYVRLVDTCVWPTPVPADLACWCHQQGLQAHQGVVGTLLHKAAVNHIHDALQQHTAATHNSSTHVGLIVL